MIKQSLLITLITILLLSTSSSVSASGEISKKNSLLNLIDYTELAGEKIKTYERLNSYSSMIQLDTSIYYSLLALKMSKEIDYKTGVGIYMASAGRLKMRNDSLLPALNYLLEAEEYMKECDCDSLKAVAYFSIGKIYFLRDNYFEAQDFFNKSLELAEKDTLNDLLFDIYTLAGFMYNELGNVEDAEYYYLKSLELRDTTVNNEKTVLSFYNLGSFYKNKGDCQIAEKYFNKAISIAVQEGHYLNLPLLYLEIGNMKFDSARYDKAFEYYKQAEAAIGKIDSTQILTINFWKTNTDFHLGMYYFATGNDQKALEIFKEIYQTALHKKLIMLESLSSEYLAMIYERTGRLNQAIYYYKKHHYLNDSIINSRNISRLAKLEMEYRHLKETSKKRIKRIELEEKHKQEVQSYKWLILSGVLSFIVVILVFMIYRSRYKTYTKFEKLKVEKLKVEKGILQKELDYKNRELTTSMMYLLKNNNSISELSKKMNTAIINLKPENKKPFQDIIKEMDAGLRNNAWEDFEIRFKNVHHDFNERLLKDFPELSPNELKLCAFLKLNMTSKDIATITFQTINSITVARHRLRTKMGIDRDENLVIFLVKY